MDQHFQLRGIHFVWDAFKARGNVKRHGVTFEQAAEVWFDPLAYLAAATAGNDPNDALVGYTFDINCRLFVVHVEIEDEFIRIISARKAEPHE